MENQRKNTYARNRAILVPIVLIALAAGCAQEPEAAATAAAVDSGPPPRWTSPTFTTAHATFGDAAKHFLNVRRKPVQPIEFPHNIHTHDIGVACEDCHRGAATGPRAGMPSIRICMSCHEDIGDPADSRIQTLRAHAARGEDMAWQRVYGFIEESHVRFNHSPHMRAQVECATCHGDVTAMAVAERAVDHTMGFCINCHRDKQAPVDCLTCHY